MSASDLQAVLLAAGRGGRLLSQAGTDSEALPKCLLEVGGRTLLDRHVAALVASGVPRLHIVQGYKADLVAAELDAATARHPGLEARVIENPRFELGSIVSLAAARPLLRGSSCLLMDADVVYPTALLARLVESASPFCFLLDEDSRGDAEEMRLGADAEGFVRAIERGLSAGHATMGEGVGFLKLDRAAGTALAAACEARIAAGGASDDYEQAIGDVLRSLPARWEPVAPHAWTEIGFAEDLDRARAMVLR